MSFRLFPLLFPDRRSVLKVEMLLMDTFRGGVHISDFHPDISDAYSPERGQYISSKILLKYLHHAKDSREKKLILTSVDLATPVLSYIFGEAQLHGNLAIVSTFRLHEELYSGEVNRDLYEKRLHKEVLHELGHNFGLLHCKDWECVMHSSSIIEEVDLRGGFYCKKCKSVIRHHLC